MMFSTNQIVESVLCEAPFEQPARVLWMNRDLDMATLFTVSEPLKKPWRARISEIESMLKAGKLRVMSMRPAVFMLQSEDELSEAAKAKRSECWALISPIFEGKYGDRIYYPGEMGSIIVAHAEEVQKPLKTIYRLLYRYWALGMTPNAFIGQYVNSGGRGKARNFSPTSMPGRPPKYLGEPSLSKTKKLTEDDKAIIRINYALFKENKVKDVNDAYTKMLNRFYRAELPSPDGSSDNRPLKQLDEIPTLAQFVYWGKKAFDEMDVKRGRKGETKWAMNHRAIVGNAHHGLRGPCHRFEIDATIADIYLVSRFNKNWIIGRPIVYVVIDVLSRMIVGIHVGLEGPSWNIARHALFNAFTDKVSFCASYGIAINAGDWPCQHLPHELVADRGEMISKAAEGLVTGLSIKLAILPPFRADWKATVERSFRTLNTLSQIHWTPGAVRTREKERGDRDYRLDATLDLQEFTKIMIMAVLHWNHQSRDPERLSKVMIEQAVDPTPIGIWNWAMEHDLIEANSRSREEIYLHLLPKSQASIKAGGIYFKGMYYVNALDPQGRRSARARAKGAEAIEVWHEPYADHIWIKNEVGAFVSCPLRGTESRCKGMRVEEVEDMLEITGAVPSERKYSDLSSRVDLDEFIETTISTALAKKDQSNIPASKSATVKNIKEKRKFELDAERLIGLRTRGIEQTDPDAKPNLPESVPGAVADYAGERSAEVISLLSRAGRMRGSK